MSTRSQLTKDLNESVKSLLGKHVKILLKNVVRLETKGDKTENRVLVFSPCRLFLLTAKVPTRIDCHFHYLEIQAIESKRGNQLSVVVGEKVYSFLTSDDSTCSHEVDNMVAALATAVRNIFPTVPLQYIIRKIDIIPNSRLQFLQDESSCPGRPNTSPCGGFSTQYACMCDYHSLPYRDEVAWDVDTIYLAHDTREICLKDFDHLDQKDLVPIISALEYNTWFTSLRVGGHTTGVGGGAARLSHEAAERILHIMRKSLSIEELHLDNLALKADFAHKLSLSLIANQATPLHTVDLSHNMIEDKGATSLCGLVSKLMPGAMHLSGPVARVPKGLVKLSLAHCGLTAKGVNQLAHAMSLNKSMQTSLTHLDLSGNNLKDDINNLYNFLAQPNAISYLDIASTETTLESLFGALLRGCATNLAYLNVSRNPFSTKKSKEVPPSFKQFFTSTLSLKRLTMAFCKLPLDALKNLLLGLACNESTTEMHLDLSYNSLGAHGAHVLESCVHGIRCISTLDISDNNMDVELAPVITAIGKNKSIKHLHMGRNVNNMKAKHIGSIMDALVQMIQEEDCVLESLYIPDSKLKGDLYNLINALGSNQCLQTIDISGNFMGDSGARLLAKALQINNRLRTIIYDKNNITLQGYSDLAYALETNYTLRYIPFPIFDVTPCMKTNSERTDVILKKIQDLLHRNVSPKKYSNGQAFRLQQGFLLSSTQQMVDRLVVQTQDTIKTLAAESCDMNNDINNATALIQDADNSKQLLPRLQEVVQRRDEGNPVEIKMKQMADDLHNVVTSYLQGSLDSMLACAGDQCPLLLGSDRYRRDLRAACSEKTCIPEPFIRTCLLDQAGTEIINRINELNLAVAANLSERVTDEVVEQLSRCHRALLGATPHYMPPRSPFGSTDSEPPSSADNTSQISDQSPMATPHMSMKRKSLHGRKMRPKSVVDSVEGLSADDIPGMLPPLNLSLPSGTHLPRSAEESLDSVAELPNASQQLQHLVKGRPRRTKTRAPTRPMLRPADMMEDLGEGLDTFFRPGSVTPTTPLISPTSDECSSLSFQADGSPNHRYNSLTSGETTPVLSDDRKGKLGRSSPLLKGVCGLLEPTPRSRSSDNLEKYSPLIGRRSQGDSPLTASPLARRATDESPDISRENSSNSICQDVSKGSDKRLDEDKRKIKTSLIDSLKSPTNGFPKSGCTDIPKSPVLKSIKDSSNSKSTENVGKVSKVKNALPAVSKPRPWSMSSDRKSGEFSLLSDGSSPNTSTGNTPDSGDALDDVSAESSGERRSVRDMAAGINRNGAGDKKDSDSSPRLPEYPIPAPRKLIPGKIIPSELEEKLVDGLKHAASNPLHKGKSLYRHSLMRDDNYNFDDSIDV